MSAAKPKAKKGKAPAPAAEESLPPIPQPPDGGWPVEEIPLDQLKLDPRLQSRDTLLLSGDTELAYMDALIDGVQLPPVEVVRDADGVNWVWDGFHRVHAARRAKREAFRACVRPGDFRLALRLSLSANVAHGLRRTNADKLKAVERALFDPEWSKLSSRALGELCGVSHEYVARMRRAKEAEQKAKPAPAPRPVVRPVLPEATRAALAEHKVELPAWDQDSLAKYPAERQQEIVKRISRDELGSVYLAAQEIEREEKAKAFRDTLAEFAPGGARWLVIDDLADLERSDAIRLVWIEARQDLKPLPPGHEDAWDQPLDKALRIASRGDLAIISLKLDDLPGALSIDEDALFMQATNARTDGYQGLHLLSRFGSDREPLEQFPIPEAIAQDHSKPGDLILLCGHPRADAAFELLGAGRDVVMWHPDEETRGDLRIRLDLRSRKGVA